MSRVHKRCGWGRLRREGGQRGSRDEDNGERLRSNRIEALRRRHELSQNKTVVTMATTSRKNPLIGWTDFSLIADETCYHVINNLADGDDTYSGIVLDDDHARMWNLDSKYLVSVADNLTSFDTGNELAQKRQPFWVDDKGFAHVLSDNLIDTKSTTNDTLAAVEHMLASDTPHDEGTKSNDEQQRIDLTNIFIGNRTEKQLQIRFAGTEGHVIRVVLAKNLPTILKQNRRLRLLLVDLYETFIDHRYSALPNLDYVFTGAPPIGRLSLTDETRFYDRLREEKMKILRYAPRAIRRENDGDESGESSPISPDDRQDDRQDDRLDQDNRQCYATWNTFVPSVDALPGDYDDIRLTAVHLFDDGISAAFWRNIVYSCFVNEEERRRQQRARSPAANVLHNGDGESAMVALVIRLRFDVGQIPANVTDKRTAINRRFKRFAAFLARVYRIVSSNQLKMAPHIFWSCCEDEHEHVHRLHNDLLKELLIGERENIGVIDRFLRIGIPRPVGSHCAITSKHGRETDQPGKANDANILGVFYRTLLNDDFFRSRVCKVGDSSVFMVRSVCGAPVYKLRDYEY